MNTVQFSPAKDDAYYQSIGAQFKANFQKVFSDGRTTVYSLHYRLEAEAVEAIAQALARADGNISNTAKLLGVSRPTLYDLLKSYDLHA